jgi:urea transporter
VEVLGRQLGVRLASSEEALWVIFIAEFVVLAHMLRAFNAPMRILSFVLTTWT